MVTGLFWSVEQSMAYILIPWIFIIAIFSGIGFFWRRAFGLRKITIEACFQAFWLGYASAIMVLQLWHFWFKVDVFALVLIVLIGISGLIWNSRNLYQFVFSGFKRNIPILLIILFIGWWLSNRATGQVGPFDAGLYHLQLVMWFSKYPLIPGLGNLHGRFAFNNSHFLYAALLDVGPWAKKSYVIANGAFMYVLIAQVVLYIMKLVKGPDGRRSY